MQRPCSTGATEDQDPSASRERNSDFVVQTSVNGLSRSFETFPEETSYDSFDSCRLAAFAAALEC